MASLLVQNPEITHLVDNETGRQHDAVDLIGSDRDKVLVLYKALHLSRRTGDNQLLCALCGVPVYLCSAPDKQHFHFKHFQEDGSCPAVTRGKLTEDQISALRYQGQRESQRHIRIKNLVAESISADTKFSHPTIEGTWKGREGKEYRRPDVRARFDDRVDVAFEVQLSTTFGRVMAEREVFYRSQGGLLLWIFGEFDLDHARLMMEVIFANNNRNAFVVNEATRDASITAGALVLECHWAQPARNENHIVWTPQRRLVRFDELTIDLERQRAFFADTGRQELRIQEEIDGPALHEAFQDFWLTYESFEGRERPDVSTLSDQWNALQRRFAGQGVHLPSRHEAEFVDFLRSIFLAKLGKSVGWKYQFFGPAAHRVHDAVKPALWLFMPVLKHYGRLTDLEREDANKSWASKVAKWSHGVDANESAFNEEHRFDGVIRLAFPELAQYVPEVARVDFIETDPPPF